MSCRAAQSYLPDSVSFISSWFALLYVAVKVFTCSHIVPSVLALSNPSPCELLLYLSHVPVVTVIHRLLFVYFLPEIEGIFVLLLLYYDITFPAIFAHCYVPCIHFLCSNMRSFSCPFSPPPGRRPPPPLSHATLLIFLFFKIALY